MNRSAIRIAGLKGGKVAVSSKQLAGLASRVEGPLLHAGDKGWDEAVTVWNGMVARVPALVLQPASARDAAVAVGFARDNGLVLSIKGGGHNIAGTAIAEGGLALDMSRMCSVTADPGAKLAHVGPGCRLRDLDRTTQKHGLATVLGFVSDTGVAGLALGGGFGYLTRRFGWTADNLEEVEVVTADGRTRTANRKENTDLFWAVRGGGGNFGVVTRFTFRLHEVGPTVTGGLIIWSAEHADRILGAFRDITEGAPFELTTAVIVLTAPPVPFLPPEWHGRPVIGMIVCHSGENAEADLAAVRTLGAPIVDLISEIPYVNQQSLLDESPSEAAGLHQYWKTEYLDGLSNEYLATFRDSALKMTSPLSYSVVFHIGGVINDRAEDDGAVGNRDARFISGFSGVWPPGDLRGREHVAWARTGWERIRPFSTGGNYVNFQLAEDGTDRVADAYGGNYERLRRIKAEYDPDNLFRVNRNIRPAA